MAEVENGFIHSGLKIIRNEKITSKCWRMHGLVKYTKCENQLFESEFDILKNILFTKPPISPKSEKVSFAKNNEYRFAWIFVEDKTDHILEVEANPIKIPLSDELKKCFI
jgi:hypothetical protein